MRRRPLWLRRAQPWHRPYADLERRRSLRGAWDRQWSIAAFGDGRHGDPYGRAAAQRRAA